MDLAPCIKSMTFHEQNWLGQPSKDPAGQRRFKANLIQLLSLRQIHHSGTVAARPILLTDGSESLAERAIFARI
ncbi:hypothetical protein [Synechococcus sp. ATX 2A4]|uniref:hypothetical protein n=1 Tax=Synechococcus sp. ATX 2A4 TaxID=2823727 RepID=UPI0020CC4AF6|nr:hypothetical protein [Synechococcus sp. ATX 2A4]